MRQILLAGVAAAALIMPAAASAQETTAIVRGTVTQDGNPVADAKITLTETQSGTVYQSSTDTSGAFTASGLRAGGPYTVAVDSAQGNTQVTGVFTVVGQPYTLPIELPTAGGGDIVVTASSIKGAGVTSDGPQTVFTPDDIRKVASVNRDVRSIEKRDPFASLDLSNSSVGAVSFAGVNPRFNRFTINGVTVGDSFGLNPDASPTGRGPVPFDAIGQFSVSIAPYDFRQGGFQGGAIDTVLLSGTNSFRGTGFYSESTDGLQGDRIGSTSQVLPKYRSKTYGATLSGPIWKDRAFFMVSAERNTDPRPVTTLPQSVPGLTTTYNTQVTGVLANAQTLYGYDPGDFLLVSNNKDEKIVGRIDVNVTDRQKLSLSYINAYDQAQIVQNNSTSSTGPSLGTSSDAYALTELLKAGIVQLNSDWSDKFSTEIRGIYRYTRRGQDPVNGRGFGQFGVCLDPTSATITGGGANPSSSTSCSNATPRVFFGPDISRQTNALFFDTWAGSFLARYRNGGHELKILAEYNENRTFNNFLQYTAGGFYFDSLASYNAKNADQLIVASPVNGQPDGAAADFKYSQWTFGIQDDWKIMDNLTVTYGFRYDLYGMRDRPVENTFFEARNGFRNTKTYKGLDNFQPRVSFNWQPVDRLTIRGGVGIFGGGSPDIYLSNSFSNTITANRVTFTRAANATGCTANAGTVTAAVCAAALNNVSGSSIPAAVLNYVTSNTAALTSANTGLIDPNFKLPSSWKATLSGDYTFFGVNFGADLYYSKVREGIAFTDVRSVVIGTLPDGRPRYGSRTPFTDTNYDIMLTNTKKGHSAIGVVRFNKDFKWGLNLGGSYTRSFVRDVSNATSSTINSNYSNQFADDPNFPAYGASSDGIAWSFKYSIGYDHAFYKDYKTRIQLFGETRAGRRFSYTMTDAQANRSPVFGTILNSGTSGERYLLYVPTGLNDPIVSYDSAATANALDAFINGSKLSKYRGTIAPKNIARNRAFTRIDLHLEQEIPTFVGKSRFTLFGDIENLPNLLNKDWGGLRQFGFPYQANTVQVQCLSAATPTGTPVGAIGAVPPVGGTAVVNTNTTQPCAQYRYSAFATPNTAAVSFNNSLYLIRLGVRFTF